jgi:hypothetical protein
MENPIDGTDGNLGRGFMSADKLEEIDIGDGDKGTPNPDSTHRVYMSKTLSQETMFSNANFLPWSLI